MSAARVVVADLEFPQTPTRHYSLWLSLGLLSGHLTAVISVNHCVIASSSGTGELTESASLGPVLQIGTARFKLLPEEVEPVRAFLAKFPSPASTSSDAAHEVTTTAVSSACGDGEATPPAFLGQAGGSLDDENTTLVHALTCGEHY